MMVGYNTIQQLFIDNTKSKSQTPPSALTIIIILPSGGQFPILPLMAIKKLMLQNQKQQN